MTKRNSNYLFSKNAEFGDIEEEILLMIGEI